MSLWNHSKSPYLHIWSYNRTFVFPPTLKEKPTRWYPSVTSWFINHLSIDISTRNHIVTIVIEAYRSSSLHSVSHLKPGSSRFRLHELRTCHLDLSGQERRCPCPGDPNGPRWPKANEPSGILIGYQWVMLYSHIMNDYVHVSLRNILRNIYIYRLTSHH